MSIALYYPHTALNDKALMKSCLLLWDQVEYISPSKDHKPQYDDPELAAAAEVVARPYVVKDSDRAAVDAEILRLAKQPHPDWLISPKPSHKIDHEQYLMFRSKFSDEVISDLIARQLVSIPAGDPHDFATHTSFGLLMMAILATQCAGSHKEMVTDRVEQYQALGKYRTFESQGEWIDKAADQGRAIGDRLDVEKVLVTISLNVIDPRSLSFETLLNMRRRESPSTTAARQYYAQSIQDYVEKLVAAKNAVDREVIEQEFESRMRQSLAALEEELKQKGLQTMLSKEMLVAVAVAVTQAPALIASTVSPWAAGVIGVGALGKLWSDYRFARARALAGSPIGYLYKSKRFPRY